MFSTRNGLYERARRKFKVQDGIKLFTYSFYRQRRAEVQVGNYARTPTLVSYAIYVLPQCMTRGLCDGSRTGRPTSTISHFEVPGPTHIDILTIEGRPRLTHIGGFPVHSVFSSSRFLKRRPNTPSSPYRAACSAALPSLPIQLPAHAALHAKRRCQLSPYLLPLAVPSVGCRPCPVPRRPSLRKSILRRRPHAPQQDTTPWPRWGRASGGQHSAELGAWLSNGLGPPGCSARPYPRHGCAAQLFIGDGTSFLIYIPHPGLLAGLAFPGRPDPRPASPQVHGLGALRRQYTLNIDGLSEVVGLDTWHHERNPGGCTVEMHGNIRCGAGERQSTSRGAGRGGVRGSRVKTRNPWALVPAREEKSSTSTNESNGYCVPEAGGREEQWWTVRCGTHGGRNKV